LARSVLGEAASWGDREELLAAIVDALGQTNYLLGRAHFPKQAPSRPPKPVPRPGQQAEVEVEDGEDDGPPVTLEEAVAALAEFRQSPT
jgi:hypothetical protein